MRVGAMMNGCGLVDGLGWGGEWGVWCWDSVGRAVDVPTQRYSTYPHLSTPNPIQHQVFPTYSDRIRTARHTPLPPTIPTLHSARPTPLPLQLYSNQPYPTISTVLRTLTHPQTHPTPSQPDPLPHLNPTNLPHYSHSINYRTLQTLIPPTPICPPRRNDLISPSKAHMSLWIFSCALTIEYKCRTSNINKRL